MNMLQNLHLQAAFALEVNTRRLRIYSISPPSTPPKVLLPPSKDVFTRRKVHITGQVLKRPILLGWFH